MDIKYKLDPVFEKPFVRNSGWNSSMVGDVTPIPPILSHRF